MQSDLEKIKIKINELDLKKKMVAKMCGYHPNSLSRILTGRVPLSNKAKMTFFTYLKIQDERN